MSRFQSPRGTRDILPGEAARWQRVEATARRVLERYGFREIRTPILEATELFVRSVGASTDIVRKEMFTLEMGDDSMTMRPEGTAPVVRAFIQAGLERVTGSERLYYIGPMFRYERPQKGRQRQFHQLGVEVIGSDDPLVDAETIEMLLAFLREAGLTGTTLTVSSVGDAACRPAYREALRAFLAPRLPRLCEDCRRRHDENPLRVFDCKVEACRRELEGAPGMIEHLCDPCRRHFEAVLGFLDAYGIAYETDPRLVRGLDYYVRTAFELTAPGLGAQNAVMGGGRYDGLVRALGGRDLPGFGWALGLERLLMLLPETPDEAFAPDFVVVPLVAEARAEAALAARELRAAGRTAVLETGERSLSAQMRRADRIGARRIVLIGEAELAAGAYLVRDMKSGEQSRIAAGEIGRWAEGIRDAS